jgi:hypothetical protein
MAPRHRSRALRPGLAVKRPRKLPTARARCFCQALSALSDGRPRRWRMIDNVGKRLGVSWDEAMTAANEAAAKGWLTMEGGHSVCLTDSGRRSESGKS